MSVVTPSAHASQTPELQRVANLLGGRRVLGHDPAGALDAHDMILHGLPVSALRHLIDNLSVLGTAPLETAIGISLRTFQRRKDAPQKPLSAEQGGRTWKFAEILARATAVFGSQGQAEQWLERPATGLDRRRPIELLATPAGTELVEDFLRRIEYGVYT